MSEQDMLKVLGCDGIREEVHGPDNATYTFQHADGGLFEVDVVRGRVDVTLRM